MVPPPEAERAMTTSSTDGAKDGPMEGAITTTGSHSLLSLAKGSSLTKADSLPTIGQIGRYALKYRLGSGGLGTVYAAHDPVLSRLIAIKTLNVDLPLEEREQFNQMFLNEARAAAGLGHQNIVTVHDAGLSDQGVYIAMELLRGNDLRKLLKDGWRPTIGQAVLIVRRVADALAYAHSRGVIHRDVKPANIFMVGRSQPRVLDFGIAQVATRQDEEESLVGGSPYYMAPEQLDQRQTDRRTDVFSLGVVLYELLTGTRPFQGRSLQEIGQAVRTHRPAPVNELQPDVAPDLADIVARAMEKDPEKRFSSARTLAHELRLWLERHPKAMDNASAEEDPPTSSRRWFWILGGAAVASGALAAASLWSSTLFPRETAQATQALKNRWSNPSRAELTLSAPALLANAQEDTPLSLAAASGIPRPVASPPVPAIPPVTDLREASDPRQRSVSASALTDTAMAAVTDEEQYRPKLHLAPTLSTYRPTGSIEKARQP